MHSQQPVNVGIMSHLSLIINFSGWKNVKFTPWYGDYENQKNLKIMGSILSKRPIIPPDS